MFTTEAEHEYAHHTFAQFFSDTGQTYWLSSITEGMISPAPSLVPHVLQMI